MCREVEADAVAVDEIKKYAKAIQIKEAKTSIVRFLRSGDELAFEQVRGAQGRTASSS
ncbi:MAG: hypothetical protein PSN37_02500 [Alphaproteobacteria bacterium]|nr:hypothetical protein [Alphaproteobacteria bacterium]